jgi:hypothetical protein
VADYQPVGNPAPNIAQPDTTGANTGNLTNALTGAFIGISVPVFECYHMTVSSVPIGAAAVIRRNLQVYSYVVPYSGSEWDPSQPMLMRPGDEIDFLWSITPAEAAGVLPVVTAFFRFDAALQVNRDYATRELGGR